MATASAEVPQATLTAIRAVVDAIAAGNISSAAIGRAAKLSERHVSYASAAAAALGLVKSDGKALRLTDAGHQLAATLQGSREEREALINGVSQSSVVRAIAPKLLSSPGPTLADVSN